MGEVGRVLHTFVGVLNLSFETGHDIGEPEIHSAGDYCCSFPDEEKKVRQQTLRIASNCSG